jgi:uncharacterized protein (DUF2235 family)
MTKRLVMCCDGTWNTAGQKCPTNVAKICRAIAPYDSRGTEQKVLYHAGVGTNRWERIRGGVFGFGLSRNVRDSYRFIVENYQPGDELFFFGFSRGAFTARSTTGFIRNAGILRQQHIDYIDKAYDLYRSDEGPDSPEAKAFRSTYAYSDETPIRFIGVWDTVGALGVPNVGLPGTNFLNRKYAFHDTKLSSRVRSAFQALAIDEARMPFQPTLWQPQPHSIGQELEQVWFAGVHCDAGGGYPEGELADIALYWMSIRAQACGLGFTNNPARPDDAFVMGRLHDSRTGLYKLLPPRHRTLGEKDPAHEYVASTATQRRKQDTYAPEKLDEYLNGPHQEMPI